MHIYRQVHIYLALKTDRQMDNIYVSICQVYLNEMHSFVNYFMSQ